MDAASAEVLVLVEDPGAANYLAGVPGMLVARGPAAEYLRARGIDFAAPPKTLAGCAARLLIAGTSQSADAVGPALIADARARGIPTAAAVDARMNAATRFRGADGNPFAYAADWLLVVDEWTAREYAALGFPRERVVVCGHPQFDRVRATRERFAGLDRQHVRRELFPGARAPVIVFAAEPLVGSNRRDESGSSRPEMALRWFLAAAEAAAPGAYLVLRLHPKNEPGDFAPLLERFDCVERDQDGLRIAFAADVVAGLTSTYLIEACLVGTPTLSIVTSPQERHWLPTVEAGVTLCGGAPDEVRMHLASLLAGGAVPCDALDRLVPPHALERIAAFVRGVLSAGSSTR
jgi:hypothetical protein